MFGSFTSTSSGSDTEATDSPSLSIDNSFQCNNTDFNDLTNYENLPFFNWLCDRTSPGAYPPHDFSQILASPSYQTPAIQEPGFIAEPQHSPQFELQHNVHAEQVFASPSPVWSTSPELVEHEIKDVKRSWSPPPAPIHVKPSRLAKPKPNSPKPAHALQPERPGRPVKLPPQKPPKGGHVMRCGFPDCDLLTFRKLSAWKQVNPLFSIQPDHTTEPDFPLSIAVHSISSFTPARSVSSIPDHNAARVDPDRLHSLLAAWVCEYCSNGLQNRSNLNRHHGTCKIKKAMDATRQLSISSGSSLTSSDNDTEF